MDGLDSSKSVFARLSGVNAMHFMRYDFSAMDSIFDLLIVVKMFM